MTAAAKSSQSRLLEPFFDLLRQGISTEKIALTIALGIILGVTPVLGSTTLLCTLAAVVLRLNLPAIQLVNGAVYPLQLILLIPFYKMGAWLFRATPSTISMRGVTSLIRTGVWYAMKSLWVVTIHALIVWFALGLIATAVLYPLLILLIRRLWRRSSAPTSALHSTELPSVKSASIR